VSYALAGLIDSRQDELEKTKKINIKTEEGDY
jgi:hypothetical protein